MIEEPHVPALKLRRFFVGEPLGDEAAVIAAHTQSCASCRGRLRQLEEEQSRFFSTVSADRFAAGVERAVRVPGPSRRPATTRSYLTVMGLGFAATGFALFLGAKPLWDARAGGRAESSSEVHRNNTKGGAGISVRVAEGRGGRQREAASSVPEPLVAGERVRVGYEPGGHRFVFVFSVDAEGRMTSLYPESGRSLPVVSGTGYRYFPDSLEFTGTGFERLFVLLSDDALDPAEVGRAAEQAYREAGGDLARMTRLSSLPGEQFHRLFRKPGGS